MRKATIPISASLLALALSNPAAALDSKGAAGRAAGAAAGVGGKAGLGRATEVAGQGKPTGRPINISDQLDFNPV
jgi:hypothetical protein